MKSLTPILLLAIAVGLFYLHIDPAYKEVQVLMDQENQYQEALDKAAELAVVKDDMLSRYHNLSQDNLARVERIVPDRVNSVKLITDIDGVAAKYNIPVRSVEVTDETLDSGTEVTAAPSSRPYYTTNIKFEVSATYPDLVAFLTDLEKSLQLVDVNSVTFTTEAVTGNIYNYEITIHTYWLKQDMES